MPLPVYSPSEAERIAALRSYDILDTLPEEDYDAITRLAAYICQTPLALVTFVDDQRQWFKSAHGINAAQTPLEHGFCAHAVSHPAQRLIVEDARLDARFRENALVKGEPNIVFYAGIPIVDEDGHALGSVCVIDNKTRQLSKEQIRALEDLTKQVVNLLKLRRTNTALAVEERQFRTFADNLQNLAWLADAEGWIFWYNRRWYDYTGTTLDKMQGWGWQGVHHPDHVERVLTDIAAFWKKDEPFEMLFPLRGRDGTYRWFLTRAVPVFDKEGKKYQWIGTNTDVDEQIQTKEALAQSESRFRAVFEQAPMAIGLLEGRDMVISAGNDKIFELWGKDPSTTGQKLIDALPELKGQPFMELLEGVYDSGTPHFGTGTLAKLVRNGVLEDAYFDFVYTPVRSGQGGVSGVMVLANEVTDRELTNQAIAASEARFRTLIEEAPVATCLFVGRQLRVDIANDLMFDIWGKGRNVIGMTLTEILPELDGQPFLKILDDVYTGGESYTGTGVPAYLVRDGIPGTYYYDFTYKPIRDESGEVYAILQMAADVTEQIMSRQRLEESESKLRSIVDTAPVAIGLFMGRDLIIENPNQTFIDIVGKGWKVAGLPLREAMPELITEGQPFLQILDDVYTTGVPFISSGSLVKIVQNGVLTSRYYNISYSPVHNAAGEIYAVLDIAVDVTEQFEIRKSLEEKEASLTGAIDLAGLGTWTIDMGRGKVYYSDEVAEWFGAPSGEDIGYLLTIVPEEDAARLQLALESVMQADSDGILDVEHRVTNPLTGRTRIIHSRGAVEVVAGARGSRIIGMGRDITAERSMQASLEQQVQIRTEELAAAIEELQSTNEELAVSNDRLTRSNEELAQYAYVASHDLQEPLRKIRMFTDLLNQRTVQDESSSLLVGRIDQSAARMSQLIRDLLIFSRLLNTQEIFSRIDLDDVLKKVLIDFELMIEEKGAVVNLNSLPSIEAVGLQMNQLFYNLLNNALKFTSADRQPIIDIDCEIIDAPVAGEHIRKVTEGMIYYRISFSDNGIGFAPEHAERIFEVFRRLHGKDDYQGSGIGLALCRRIVINHQGALFTISREGAGATFTVILPERQSGEARCSS